ncbi:hypothetical protein DA717_12140 [Piscirickettsiaceae bacterium NZ-RLO2]|nr:hypothetical protein DA717_12140 [Piscirickettsiaceae bacterium NZ-RLO2]
MQSLGGLIARFFCQCVNPDTYKNLSVGGDWREKKAIEPLVFFASVQYIEKGYTADRVVKMLKKIGERFSPFRLFEPWKAGRVQLV